MTLTETMTPRQRVMNALAGKPVDRTPVANPTNVATVELMDMVDAPFPEACRDPELAARLAATGHTELGFDAIMPYFTIIQESSALGCEMQWEEKDNWPTVRMANPIWKTEEDIHIPPGFLEHPDNITITRSISLLKEEFGDEVAIIGKTMGPWTLAYHVFGVETFLLMTVDDPDMTMRCLDELKEISVLFGQAQIDAGADALTFPDHATGDLVSGEYYRRFLLEIHQGDGGTAGRAAYPAHLRQHAGQDALHRADRHGGVPLRLQERPAGCDGRRGWRHQPHRQHQQPGDAVRAGSRRGARRGAEMPRRRGAARRAGVRYTARHQTRKPNRNPPRREGMACGA